MNTLTRKWTRALAITVAALQIPLLMLWKITVDCVKYSSQGLEITDRGYELVFQWDELGGAILIYLPVLLALAGCLILSVLGLISVFRKTRTAIPTVCIYAASLLAGGFLCLTFAWPAAVVGRDHVYGIVLHEFIFFRYFGGLDLHIGEHPWLESIKFIFLGLHIAGSGALCALGITDLARRRKAPPVTETAEPELYQIQGRRKTE